MLNILILLSNEYFHRCFICLTRFQKAASESGSRFGRAVAWLRRNTTAAIMILALLMTVLNGAHADNGINGGWLRTFSFVNKV